MKIIIKRLTLTNFKCFRNKEIQFDGDVTTISGRNGVGKTTIADAILWCLFGKNSQGQADFDLKTHNKNGNPIPNLDHSVEMVLNCDFGYVTLKRTLKETWVKKRGSDEQVFKNNTTEYIVNGDSYTAADYKKYIAQLVDEDVFKAITSPTYFPSLKWQVQREFLTKMAGDIEPNTIAAADEEIKTLIGTLGEEDIISYRKHLSYQIKQIKDKLDKIPVRLEEQNKALPELLDWDALETEKKDAQKELEEIELNMRRLQTGNAADLKRGELCQKAKELKARQNTIYEEAVKRNLDEYKKKQKKISDASLRFNEALNNQKLMQQTIEADDRLIERTKETDYEEQLQQLRDQWPSSKFDVDPSTGYCPTCGQPLPQEQVQEKIEEMRRNFNLQREAKIKQLNESAAKIKKQQADAAEELTHLEQKLVEDNKSLEAIKDSINSIFAEKQEIEKIVVKTVDEMLADNEEFSELSKQLEEISTQIDSIVDSADDKKLFEELSAKNVEISEKITGLMQKTASRLQYDKILALIDGINEEQKDLVRQLSELEKKEDVARRYQDRQNAILEERINEHFKVVQWKMFRTVNNGGDPFDEPYCECYVDGVAYHDGLNQAARLNAGLDIINTLCKHYNVSAPIVLDNSESTINILQTIGQQIRLQVADTELQIA